MARNRSEKPPHPEVPERFHERARLWEIYSLNRSVRNGDIYNDYCDTFSATESSRYGSLPVPVIRAMKRYYAMMAGQADRAA